jgi:nucleoid-associated protein YgaU
LSNPAKTCDAEVVPYWRAVIEANRDRLADRDNPSLVFPGQEFVLPATLPLTT